MANGRDPREPELDLWLALLAGDRPWRPATDTPELREQGVATFVVIALGMVLVTQWVALGGRFAVDGNETMLELRLAVAMAASVVAVAALAAHPIRIARAMSISPRSFSVRVVWRGLAYAALIACTAGILVRRTFLGAVPLGLVAGGDALLTIWTLGMTPSPWRWLRRFAFSAVHFGVLGAMLATAWLEPQQAGTLLLLYAALWVGFATAMTTVVSLNHLNDVASVQRSRDRDAIRNEERDHRAHWLHDDVLSEVRLTTLRIGDDYALAHARQELLDLDHRLRLRQLDELLRSGSARIYEVLQPHLRRAQALGIELTRVPSLEVTGRELDEAGCRVLHRAVSILTSNAINAGTSRLAIDLAEDTDSTVLTVTDNAGGFELDSVHAGRGLDSLRRDLGDDAVWVEPVPNGAAVSVRLRVSDDAARRGSNPPRGSVAR